MGNPSSTEITGFTTMQMGTPLCNTVDQCQTLMNIVCNTCADSSNPWRTGSNVVEFAVDFPSTSFTIAAGGSADIVMTIEFTFTYGRRIMRRKLTITHIQGEDRRVLDEAVENKNEPVAIPFSLHNPPVAKTMSSSHAPPKSKNRDVPMYLFALLGAAAVFHYVGKGFKSILKSEYKPIDVKGQN